jgi:hypothetical protein
MTETGQNEQGKGAPEHGFSCEGRLLKIPPEPSPLAEVTTSILHRLARNVTSNLNNEEKRRSLTISSEFSFR